MDGYEYFIDKEMPFLSKAFKKIIIYPFPTSKVPSEQYFKTPENAEVRILEESNAMSVRALIMGNVLRIGKWWIYEFANSPHRWKYITKWRWNLYNLIGIMRIADNLSREKIPADAVLYSYWFNEWADVLAWSKQSWLKNNFVSRAHGYDYDEKQQPNGYHSFRYIVWKYIQKVYQVSEYGIKYMKNQGLRGNKIMLARLGSEDMGAAPIPYGAEYILVSCSNFYPVKRLHLIPQILKYMDVEYHWIHFGGGDYMEHTLEEIKGIIPEKNYTVMGPRKNEEILEYYKRNGVDMVLNVSRLEGIPVSLMEAISFGIPIMGCDTCGVPEIVTGETGILNEINFDPEEVAKKMSEFLKNKSRNLEYRKGIRQFYQGNFNAEINAEKFVSELQNTQTQL